MMEKTGLIDSETRVNDDSVLIALNQVRENLGLRPVKENDNAGDIFTETELALH